MYRGMPERRLTGLITALGLLGALLVVVAQFLPLFHTYVSPSRRALDTVSAGSEHGWALLPVAALAALLLLAVRAAGSRPALIAAGVMALAALGITLGIDLPAAHQTGLASLPSGDVPAGNSPGVALYVEVAGGLVLLLAVIAELVLTASPAAPAARSTPPAARPSGGVSRS